MEEYSDRQRIVSLEEYSDKQYIALLEAKIDIYERAIEVLEFTIKTTNDAVKS